MKLNDWCSAFPTNDSFNTLSFHPISQTPSQLYIPRKAEKGCPGNPFLLIELLY